MCQGWIPSTPWVLLTVHLREDFGRHLLGTLPQMVLQMVALSLHPHYCLGFRFLELCGLPLVSLAFFDRKSFLPRQCFPYRGSSFQGPWTATGTERWWAAWCISGKAHGVSAASVGLSSGKGLVLGHPQLPAQPQGILKQNGFNDFLKLILNDFKKIPRLSWQ